MANLTNATVGDYTPSYCGKNVVLLRKYAALRAFGFEPAPSSPEEFRDFIRKELAKFGQVIVEAGVRAAQ